MVALRTDDGLVGVRKEARMARQPGRSPVRRPGGARGRSGGHPGSWLTGVVLTGTVLAACSLGSGLPWGSNPPPGGSAPAKPQNLPPKDPIPPRLVTHDFASTSVAPFVDPTTEDERRTGRFAMGRWLVKDGFYQQTLEAAMPSLSLRRYIGSGLGQADGKAHSRYRMEVTLQALRPVSRRPGELAGAPVGVLGIIPYFLDSTHYVMLEAVQDRLELWFVDGLTPGDAWQADTHMRFQGVSTPSLAVGRPITLAAEIDTRTGTVQIEARGELREVVTDPTFVRDVPHGVALVSNGNFVGVSRMTLSSPGEE